MKVSNHISKTFIAASAFTLLMQASLSHAAALDISQSPLMLVDSVAPNLLFTLDDSGSMEFAYAPDGLGDSDSVSTRYKFALTTTTAVGTPGVLNHRTSTLFTTIQM